MKITSNFVSCQYAGVWGPLELVVHVRNKYGLLHVKSLISFLFMSF